MCDGSSSSTGTTKAARTSKQRRTQVHIGVLTVCDVSCAEHPEYAMGVTLRGESRSRPRPTLSTLKSIKQNVTAGIARQSRMQGVG